MSEENELDEVQEAERKAAEARARQAMAQADADTRAVMGTPEGRRYVWRLLTRCGIYRLSYAPNDVTATAFNEGGRNIGLGALADVMRVCPEHFQAMVSENQGEPA